ncbi:MAG: hypothetical protein ACI9EA_001988, partial [Pseudomonadales bacterium]
RGPLAVLVHWLKKRNRVAPVISANKTMTPLKYGTSIGLIVSLLSHHLL